MSGATHPRLIKKAEICFSLQALGKLMKHGELSEAILVLNCQSLDESAFRELVNRWEPILYYYLRRIVDNEDAVWDILQETWLAVFQSIHKLRDTRKFPAWLYQIRHFFSLVD